MTLHFANKSFFRQKAVWLVSVILLLAGCVDGALDRPLIGQQAIPPPDATQPSLSGIPQGPTPEGGPALVFPTETPYPAEPRIVIGQSVQGRELTAYQFGSGPVTLMLVGGIHGGYEFNSVLLVEQLAGFIQDNPQNLLPGIRLLVVPNLNPDGAARGRDINARFNANGVDLNRNWGCGWLPTSYWRDQETSPGPRPFSEPETVALRSYILASEPDAVVLYHSAGGGVFVGACDGDGALWLTDLLANATGYDNAVVFEYYELSGTASDWLDERGIPAVAVELSTREGPDYPENVAGLMALQCHFALDGSTGVVTEAILQICAQWTN